MRNGGGTLIASSLPMIASDEFRRYSLFEKSPGMTGHAVRADSVIKSDSRLSNLSYLSSEQLTVNH